MHSHFWQNPLFSKEKNQLSHMWHERCWWVVYMDGIESDTLCIRIDTQ